MSRRIIFILIFRTWQKKGVFYYCFGVEEKTKVFEELEIHSNTSREIIRRSFNKTISYCDKGRTRIVKILEKLPFSEGDVFVAVELFNKTAVKQHAAEKKKRKKKEIIEQPGFDEIVPKKLLISLNESSE